MPKRVRMVAEVVGERCTGCKLCVQVCPTVAIGMRDRRPDEPGPGKRIAELAPNMRRVEQCERERLPLTVRLEMDGELLAEIEAPPSGLWNDGAASVYERFAVEPGRHNITAKLRRSATSRKTRRGLISCMGLLLR